MIVITRGRMTGTYLPEQIFRRWKKYIDDCRMAAEGSVVKPSHRMLLAEAIERQIQERPPKSFKK